MYSLRMFLPEPQQTNVEIGKFIPLEGFVDCHVCHVLGVEIPEIATLQLYPGNAKKDCFYSIQPDSQLYVYDDERNFKGRVTLNDEYLYFKATANCVAIYVFSCKGKADADALLNKILNA